MSLTEEEEWWDEPEEEEAPANPFPHYCDATCYLIDAGCARCGMQCHYITECPRLP